MSAGDGTTCVGCLDSAGCWVCLGAGILELRAGQIGPCHRCYGSGLCATCQPIRLIDLTGGRSVDSDLG